MNVDDVADATAIALVHGQAGQAELHGFLNQLFGMNLTLKAISQEEPTRKEEGI